MSTTEALTRVFVDPLDASLDRLQRSRRRLAAAAARLHGETAPRPRLRLIKGGRSDAS